MTATDVTVVGAWDARTVFLRARRFRYLSGWGTRERRKKRKKGFDFRNDKAATRVGKTGRDYGRSVTVGLFFSHGLLWCELSRLTEPVRAAAERQGHADIYRHSVACVRLLCVNPGERPFRVSHAARQLGFTISPSPNSGIC